MGRHLRRHGLPDPDRWISELMDTVDPATLATKMAARPKARAAFAEMLWSRLLQPYAYLRRWPNRLALRDQSLSDGTLIDLEPGSGPLRFDGPSVSHRAERWLGYHAMAMEARLAWDSAARRTQGSVDDRWADWSRSEEAALAGRIRLVQPAERQGPAVRGLQPGHRNSILRGSSVPAKKQRQGALAQARLEQRQRLEALAGRPLPRMGSPSGLARLPRRQTG